MVTTAPIPPSSASLAKKRNAVLLASARKIEVDNPDDLAWLRKQRQAWQSEAWRFNDTLGEVNFPHRYLANMISRVNIYPAWRPDPNSEPIPMIADDPPDGAPAGYAALADAARLELDRLTGPSGSFGPILGPMAWNIGLVGECYLVGLPDEDDPDGEAFDVLSIDELKIESGGKLRVLRYPGDNEGVLLDPNTYFLRLWRRHPRWRSLADAPMSALLDVCEELQLLGRAIMASARSRLNAGILAIPQEMLFVDGVDLPDQGDAQRRDPFFNDMEEATIQPVLDPSHPSSLVPLFLRAPGEQIANIRHILFDRPVEDQQLKERQELRQRLATGLDIPAEVLLGMADANHWTAWQIDEQTWKAHLEPLVVLITESLTKGFLHPALQEHNVDPTGVLIGHDATELFGNEGEFDMALAMHQEMAVNHAFLRRKGGASEEDAPTDEELENWPTKPAAPVAPDPNADPNAQDETATTDKTPPGDQTQREAPKKPDATDTTDKPAVAASARGKSPDMVRLSMRLAFIDRELRLATTEKANVAVRHTLERAGASLRRRLKSPIAKGANGVRESEEDRRRLDIALRATPNMQLAAAIGEPKLKAMKVDFARLLNDDYSDFQTWFYARCRRAYRASITSITKELRGEDPDPITIDTFEQDAERNIDAGWQILLGAITGYALGRLFEPSPTSPKRGEFDAHSMVLPGDVREAIAVAGGAVTTGPDVLTGEPSGGIATGDLVEQTLETLYGITFGGGTWVYGDPSSRTRPFEPHELLDGVEFVSWQDPALQAGGSWPDVEYYFPGDHAYCQCDFIPNLEIGASRGEDA